MVDAPTRQLLSILAHLCTRSYLPPNRDHPYHGWRCIANADEGGVWLWRNGYKNEFALIIRGTKNVQDLWHDLHLASSSSHLSSGEKWHKACREKWEVVDELLRRHRVRTDAKLTISGHSLGASFAEYIFIRLEGRGKVKGVTFDSSGLPDWMIPIGENIEIHLDNLTICNNSPNFVNTLNKPLAKPKNFYSLGRGAGIEIKALPGAALDLIRHEAKHLAIRVCGWNLTEHSIRKIQSLIDDDEIQSSTPADWPRYTGTALKYIPEAGTLVGTGAGAWSIGMAGWGACAGPVLAGPGGAIAGGTIIIAAGPLAAVLTATGAVYVVRQTEYTSKIKSICSRLWSSGNVPVPNRVPLQAMRRE